MCFTPGCVHPKQGHGKPNVMKGALTVIFKSLGNEDVEQQEVGVQKCYEIVTGM